MKKAIVSKHTGLVKIIERTEYSDSFEHIDINAECINSEHITRKEWRSSDWSEAFVYIRGAFWMLTDDRKSTTIKYNVVDNNDLRRMVDDSMHKRSYSDNICDYSFEEVSQMRAFAVLAYNADEMERYSSVAQTFLSRALNAIEHAAQQISDSISEATTTDSIEYVSIVPQCDELGYQSESLAVVDILANGTCYTFANMRILEARAYHPYWSYTFVQVDEEGEPIARGMHEVDVRGMDEDAINADIAQHLIDSELFECEVC